MYLGIVRRLSSAVVALVVLTFVTFGLVQLLPGGPEDALFGSTGLSPEDLAAFRDKWGLDRSIPVQYVEWLKNLLHGDFGVSITSGRPVLTEVSGRLWPSLQIAILSIVLALVLGVAIGTFTALRQHSAYDSVATGLSVVGASIPDFVLAALLLIIIPGNIPGIPTSGYAPLSDGVLQWAGYMFLPVFTLVVALVGICARLTRSSVIATLGAEHVRTALGSGLPRRTVIAHYVVRPSLGPVITTAGLLFVGVTGGIIVVEQIFAIPGMGRLVLDSINNRDYPILQAVVFMIGILAIVVSLIVGLVNSALDPRTR